MGVPGGRDTRRFTWLWRYRRRGSLNSKNLLCGVPGVVPDQPCSRPPNGPLTKNDIVFLAGETPARKQNRRLKKRGPRSHVWPFREQAELLRQFRFRSALPAGNFSSGTPVAGKSLFDECKRNQKWRTLSNRPATPARRLGDFQTVLTKHRLAAGLAIWSDTHPFS